MRDAGRMRDNTGMKTPSENQARFDRAAATWDDNPARRAMAQAIAEAMRARVPIDQASTVIDFGCGTGLVTLALQPYAGRVIGIDSSPGMLAVLTEKAHALGVTNVETLCLDLATQPAPDVRATVIVSAMALHHIADIPALLRALLRLLSPGGYLALADLDREDGSFHQDPTGVYHAGIDRDWLMAQLRALGVQHLHATTAHVIERPAPEGIRRYPIFFVSGQTPPTISAV